MILETFIKRVNDSMVVHHTNLDTSKVDLKLMPGQRDFQHHNTTDIKMDDEALKVAKQKVEKGKGKNAGHEVCPYCSFISDC